MKLGCSSFATRASKKNIALLSHYLYTLPCFLNVNKNPPGFSNSFVFSVFCGLSTPRGFTNSYFTSGVSSPICHNHNFLTSCQLPSRENHPFNKSLCCQLVYFATGIMKNKPKNMLFVTMQRSVHDNNRYGSIRVFLLLA